MKSNLFYSIQYLFRVKKYIPRFYEKPNKTLINQKSAWAGLDEIIKDIIIRSGVANNVCLEFGVEFAYSTVALSNYFSKVIGVDTFEGDEHAGYYGDIYEKVKEIVHPYNNIELIKNDYKAFIKDNNSQFDLIHVDIVHTYEATFECGIWAATHAGCVIFHDTESFPEVKKAVLDISILTKKKFYNYKECNGLGILF
jgi:hypothetical protein